MKRLIIGGLVLSVGLLVASAVSAAEFVSLFDGKSLDGWTQRNGTATYRIEGDTIVGRTAEGSPNSFLCTDKLYDNFELLFEVKVDSRLNSGVQIRSATKDGPKGRVNGPQIEIEASGADGSLAGYVYGEAAGGWMTLEADRKPHQHFKNDDWNEFRVLADGANIKVWINGEMISDLTDKAKLNSHPQGFIALQVHGIGQGQGPYEVAWRKLKIRELSGKLDASKLVGDWTQVRGEVNGAAIGEDRLRGLVTITDKTLTLAGDDGKFVFAYEIDAQKTPAAIKLTMTESPFGGGAETVGVIRVSDKQLELCYAMEGGETPTEFKAPENSNHRYIVMQKKKAE